MPMPNWPGSENSAQLALEEGGCTGDVASWEKKHSTLGGRSQEVSAWTNLVCLALNKMAGWNAEVPPQRKGKQTLRAVDEIQKRVGRFLQLFPGEHVDQTKLWRELKTKKISYDGEEFTEPVPISFNQIVKSLPPEGHGGSVDLVPLLRGQARFLLQHPEANLLEAEEREPGPCTAKVHITPGEELKVWKLLESRGIIKWIPLDEVHRDQTGCYLSGLFGVVKPQRFTDEGLPLLRVIMNLKPINRALKIIKGDIGELRRLLIGCSFTCKKARRSMSARLT